MSKFNLNTIKKEISKYEKLIKLNKLDTENRLKLTKYILTALRSLDENSFNETDNIAVVISDYILLAFKMVQEVIKIDDKNAEAYFLAAQIGFLSLMTFNQKSIFEQTVVYFEKAIEYGNNNIIIDLYLNYSVFLSYFASVNENEKENKKILIKAVDLLKKIIEIEQNDYNYYNYLGNTLFQLAVYENKTAAKKILNEAIEAYNKSLSFNTTDYMVYNGLAFTQLTLSDFESTIKAKESQLLKSAENYEKVISFNVEDYVPYKNYGEVLRNSAELKKKNEDKLLLLEKALKIVKKATVLIGDYFDYDLYALLRVILSETVSYYPDKNTKITLYTQLKELSEKLLEVDKEDYYNYYDLGKSYYFLATFEENNGIKEKMLEKSVELFDFLAKKGVIDIEINYNFAVILKDLANLKADIKEKSDLLKKARKIIKKIIEEASFNHSVSDFDFKTFLTAVEKELKELK